MILKHCLPVRGGVSAITLGHVVLGQDRESLAANRLHERAHVRQYEILGPAFIFVYLAAALWALIRGRGAYKGNYLERKAVEKEKMIMRIAIVLSIFVAGLLTPAVSLASDATLETSHLIVSDATGKLSNEKLTLLANHTQETLNRILVFWSADPGIRRFGKIRVAFDVPRRDVYSSVFYWDKKEDQRIRIVRVFGIDGEPQMMAHKLTSAVFPQKDKLIRNMMGILTEAQIGNPLTFPMCGFGSDE